jgi:quinol monooxygenase YgiN
VLAVLVSFEVKDGRQREFRESLLENAKTSLAVEPGCKFFDVCVGEKSTEFVLYELYDSHSSFQEHLNSPHFRAFDASAADLVEVKKVRLLDRLSL